MLKSDLFWMGCLSALKLSFCNTNMLSFHIPADFLSVASHAAHTVVYSPRAICQTDALKTPALTLLPAVTLSSILWKTPKPKAESPLFSPHSSLKNRAGCILFSSFTVLKDVAYLGLHHPKTNQTLYCHLLVYGAPLRTGGPKHKIPLL